jgi:hypothetical protein
MPLTAVTLKHRHLERLVDGQALRDGITGGGGWSALLELFTKGPPPDLTQPPSLRPGPSGQVHVAVYRMPMA